ncbi:MAG TPA: ABC transporter ATP-binding protein [Candidatus Coprovicinus avistercoris]|uniref:ABC transporter ATP-binding protein n=1 Tax=Candidatus Coprovicinus avistercoris TaxID=2840754 RepID=A0A9D1HVU1_9ACTN|nr:ABC transporter ATP-binding protein [Candidatus Coprovicinus avistercoris]
MSAEHLVELHDVYKLFAIKGAGKGNAVHAVDGVSFNINPGETVGLVGESGSGKTTLAKLLLGLTPMTSGSILIDGVEVTPHNRREYQGKMGAVFQDPASSLNPRWTVRQVLRRPLVVNHIADADALIEETCEKVGLGKELLDRRPQELSGGQQQRVSVARAVMLKPSLLVLDEPTSALDVSVQAQTLNVLLDLQESEGLAYLFITHNLSVVRYMADRICVMYGGKVMEVGDTEQIVSEGAHPYTRGLVSSVPPLHPSERSRERHTMKGDVPSLVNVDAGCRFASRCPYAEEACRVANPEAVEVAPGHLVYCRRVKELHLA